MFVDDILKISAAWKGAVEIGCTMLRCTYGSLIGIPESTGVYLESRCVLRAGPNM